MNVKCTNSIDFDIYSPKVLVIPRNRWLRLNMTEKLFTGTLNQNKKKTALILFHCAQQTYQRSLYQTLTDINIKNQIFRILHSKCITIIISICHFDHRIFKLTTVIKQTCILKGKFVFFVKLHPKSANDRDTSDCNDTGSLEACI